MKKKTQHRKDISPGPQSTDYVVGQVSESVFKQNSGASGSLSTLFSASSPQAHLLFQPAPKIFQKSSEMQHIESSEIKKTSVKIKKACKESLTAEQKLEQREINLQKADEDEQGQMSKKKKRKASEAGVQNDVEHYVMKRQRLKASKQEEALKMKRTIFVGNLPSNCTRKTVRNLFRDKGQVESIRFRSVVREDPSISRKQAAIKRKVHPQRKSINAYVVFKNEDAVEKALERNGLEIQKEFHIRVDRVTANPSHDHKRSIFVGNLSFEIEDLAFRTYFEKCGKVEGVRLVRDKNTGLGKGFGYVLFESADSVQLALKLDGSKLEGRAVRVKRSVKKEKQKNKGTTSTVKDSEKEKRLGQRRHGSPKKQTRSAKSSFKGVMVDPQKNVKKGLKKKRKLSAKKSVHI